MDEFLTPVSTTKVKQSHQAKAPSPEHDTITNARSSDTKLITIDNPQTALEAIKDQPGFESVRDVLEYLAREIEHQNGFHPMLPDPVAANIIHQLVHTTIPDYWKTLQGKGKQRRQLIRCLQNPSGIGNIVTRLRSLIADCRETKPTGSNRDSSSHISDLLDVLEEMLQPDQYLIQVWKDVAAHSRNDTQKSLMWKEFVTQTASGRIISIVAEAEDALKTQKAHRPASWLADGSKYASWLGRNMADVMSRARADEEITKPLLEVCSKALTLGYLDEVVCPMVLHTIDHNSVTDFSSVIARLKVFEQRKYLNAIMTYLSRQYLGTVVYAKEVSLSKNSLTIAGIAAFISEIIKSSDTLKEHLISSLTKSIIPALDDSLGLRRSAIAALAQYEDQLNVLLESSLKVFGDSFFIKHTPILLQEGKASQFPTVQDLTNCLALAQTLVITCGYAQRLQRMLLVVMAKSSHHTSGMSNRIGSSSSRARFLGMAVGMVISRMVDKPETRLNFDFEGDDAAEAQWYQDLADVNDPLGKISDLKVKSDRSSKRRADRSDSKPATYDISKQTVTQIQGPRIIEILSDEDGDEDDDLVPYPKPDSDPEDETDDPTEINRNKPIAPVYIRDLVAGLRDTENYDRHALALSAAASLIRRKANFGSEVLDHIDELATILVGLNDSFELQQFAEHRQQALIAVLLAKPNTMAPWFARSFFAGDYSITQRTAMLTTLGLGARELAGLERTAEESFSSPTASFPSKQLPPNLHALYSKDTSSPTPLTRITSSMMKQLLSPLAAQAADSLTGPSILKVGQSRTFSSRMEVEARRSKPIPNALSQMVAENFFFPLTGRWWLATRNSMSNSSLYTSTHLLPAFLHTLALLMNASGPNTIALPQMTRELWELLLSCRAYALDDKKILSALLFAFLMLLETNGDKERLATEQGKELMETQEWVRMVFEGLPAGKEGGEDDKVRVLAAGVVVRCQEVVEKYQRRLVGSMMDY